MPAPSTPTGLAATPGNAQVACSWNTVGGNVSGYRLYRNGTRVYDGLTAAFTDTALTNGTTYSYTVSAYNAQGESAKSTAVTATPVAPAPPPTAFDTALNQLGAGVGPSVHLKLADAAGSTTAADREGVDNGTVQGTVTFGTTGFLPGDTPATCATFDGATGNIVLADPTRVVNQTAFTAGIWVVPTAVMAGGTKGVPFTKVGDAPTFANDQYGVDVSSTADVAGKWGAYIRDSAGYNLIHGGQAVAGHPTLLVMSWNGTTLSFWADKTLLGQVPSGAPILNRNTAPMRIGSDGGADIWNGPLSNFFFLPFAISQTDVEALYNAGMPNTSVARTGTDAAAMSDAPSPAGVHMSRTGSDSAAVADAGTGSVSGGATAASYSDAIRAIPNLQAYWRLNTLASVVDEQGGDDTGSYAGTVTLATGATYPGANSDQAVDFNATGSANVTLSAFPLNLSFGTLVYLKAIDSTSRYLVSTQGAKWGVRLNSSGQWTINAGGTNTVGDVAPTGGWVDLVATFSSGGNQTLYLAGQPVLTSAAGTFTAPGAFTLHLADGPVGGVPWNGLLDEAFLVAREMTAAEVASLHAAYVGTGGGGPSSVSRSGSDSAALADVSTRTAARPRAASDAAVVADTATRTAAKPRASTDGATLTDSAVRGSARPRAASDAGSLTDASVRTLRRPRASSDATGVGDAATKTPVARGRTGTDTAGLADSAARASLARARSTSDPLSLVDAAVRTRSVHRAAPDAFALADVNGVSKGHSTAGADAGAIGESVTRTVSRGRSSGDAVAVSDMASTGGGGQRAAVDVATIADTSTRAASKPRATSDVLAVGESNQSAGGALATGQDTAAINDVATRSSIPLSRAATDVATLDETTSRAQSATSVTTDGAAITDAAARARQMPRMTVDEAVLADLGARVAMAVTQFARADLAVGDTVGASGAGVTRAATDVMSISEAVATFGGRVVGILEFSGGTTSTSGKGGASGVQVTTGAVLVEA